MKNEINILVVEDECIVSMEIQDRLKRLGYKVCGSASSGEEAIRKVREEAPQLVLMDIKLKGNMDGIETAESILSEFNIPVVYLTAFSDSTTLERAKISEPFGYLLKPFEERILHTTIEMALYRHKMDKKLRESEQWFATTLKSIGDAVITIDSKGNITFMNHVAELVTEWKQEEALGKDLSVVFKVINEETRKAVDNPAEKALEDGVVVGLANHTVLLSKTGKEIPIDDSAAPIVDDNGNIFGAVLVFRDITEHKLAEKKQLQLLEKLANTNQELREFAYIVSHDLKAPLRGIGSLAEWLSLDYRERLDEEGKELLNLLNTRVKRMRDLIEGVLQYSKIGRLKEERMNVDLNHIVKEIIDIIDPSDNISITIKDTLPTIICEKTHIEQVFQNLISNSVKYMDKDNGQIEIECTKQNGYWQFSVADNGPGIDEKYHKKIFQIFQTLTAKDSYESTGIGLTLVKKIVETNGGAIWIKSEVGKGSTFFFTLPR